MKKKPTKKTNKVKVSASKKAAPKKVAKKSKPVAKKSAPAKKKVEKKVVKSKNKPEPKKIMKKPEAKKAKAPVKKAPTVIKKEVKIFKPVQKVEAKPAPKAEVKAAPAPKVEAKKAAPAKAAADEKQRYNEKELAEFKTLIVDKLDQAKKDYELLKNTLCHTDDHGTDDTSPTFKALEDGSDVLTREETAQLALRQEKFIQNLQNALVRIQNKTYGICRVTGKLIPKERLLRVPHATLSIDAKLVQQFNQ